MLWAGCLYTISVLHNIILDYQVYTHISSLKQYFLLILNYFLYDFCWLYYETNLVIIYQYYKKNILIHTSL
ncbi:hypothetical protein EDF66_110107 [Sphingobacterium sp. JUb20]|nr:hypothetical protein [Sphingobacterium sp. JUb21]TCR01471.1 hypothetical protein EDF66_110107 [Sphingobacterium sp. JUb20]